MTAPFEIFPTGTPGLEQLLADEATEKRFQDVTAIKGGVSFHGTWADVWRANLELRGATRVLARMGSFMAFLLAQLDKRARKFPWGDVLRTDLPVKVEVTCKASKIYHAGAASQRIETALTESHGIPVSKEAELVIKRGHKHGIGKAPMRETLASLMLRACGFTGAEPIYDPMCGSGTFPIEAAEIAAGLQAGRSRSFAFEQLASFDAEAFAALRKDDHVSPPQRFYGSDRDAGAIKMSTENAARAGVSALTDFQMKPVSDIAPPDGPPGLVIVNPPYGARIGNKKLLYPLYGSLGEVLGRNFKGWRVGLVTSEPGLAKATGLPFLPQGPSIPHGGLKVWLFRTEALG